MVVIGGIIGAGIFLNPAIVAQRVHSAAFILTAWIIGGAVALIGALAFAELGARRPQAGGGARRAFPAGKTVVSESGIATTEQLDTLAQAGVHGVLVGESLMRSPDPEATLRALRTFIDADDGF